MLAKIFKWHIDKIYFYPYGGYTKFNEEINKPLYQELLIMLGGPLFQIIYYYIISFFISYKGLELLNTYHYAILLFNLLPIYPLDGGKLMHIVLNYFVPFRKSFNLIVIASYCLIILGAILVLVQYKNMSLTLMLVFVMVICKLTQEAKKEHFYFNKFLLERYLNNYKFKKVRIIKDFNDMYKDCKHIFFMRGRTKTEKNMLDEYFSSKR